ncbi:patatin-like phospholipase family protein [Kordiimonas laminariae]|uniref:patatin-like phospholipase family protein n=1 Tax=Kordiimonas laminariae TaxID=2917717 RepID=UPI001FF4501F|nr:patatin-like phospholipase family protein [Kordiimonas laminariae]MCK0067958.1 patatin-like phospholipase family protein [Kordiimonas laminariae]
MGLLSTSLTADSHDQKQEVERPKIGLVLSGGGAKGAAHIGVLEQLEAMNVQVDCIAGTSFGAIVGGLYASGVSVNEMKKSLQDIDWDTVLSNSIPRQQQTFRRKQDTDSFLIPYQFGIVDGKVVNPPAFIDNANLSQVIRGLLKSSHGNIDFDNLPIPFRAVATDFSNGSEVVLGDGNLADAIVASMSVPSLFPVFELNGKLLVDGGIANNVPVSVARNMCADRVIVVNLAVDPEKDAHENRGITGALKQISALLTYQNARIQLASINEESGDIIITPDMEGFSFTDFKKTLEIAAIGKEAAVQVESKLAAYSVDDTQWTAFAEAREAKTQHADPYIREIQITNDSPLVTAKLEAFLGITAGDKLDKAKLERGLSQLYGLGYFDRIKYTIDEHELGGSKLAIDAKYREWAKDTLRFGVAFDDNFNGESSVQLSLQHTRNGLNGLGGEWRNEVEIGSNQRLQTQLYQPLDYKEKHFLQATARFQRTGVPFRDEDGIITLELGANVLDFSLSAGRNFGQWGSFSVGAAYSLIDIERRSGLITDPQLQAIIDNDIVDDLGAFANFRIDTLDSLTFPRKGMILNANYIVDVGQGDAFSNGSLQLEFAAAKSWGRNTLAFFSEFGTNFSDNEEFQNVFQLGGFRSLSGFSRNELAGSHITQAGLTFYRRMGDDSKVLFDSPLYLGFSSEIGNVWADLDDFSADDLILGGTLFAGVESPIGPIFIGGSHNNAGRTSFFLFIGGIF